MNIRSPHSRFNDDPTAYIAVGNVFKAENPIAYANEQRERRMKQVRHKRPGGQVRTSIVEITG